MLGYRLMFKSLDGGENTLFILTCDAEHDDEIIRIAHVAADVMLMNNKEKFSIKIGDKSDRPVATIREYGQQDSVHRPITYSNTYIPPP